MMKIHNKSNLPYKIIGEVIDFIGSLPEDTMYEGKIDISSFVWKDKEYNVQIRYLKRDVEWIFTEKGDNNDK